MKKILSAMLLTGALLAITSCTRVKGAKEIPVETVEDAAPIEAEPDVVAG